MQALIGVLVLLQASDVGLVHLDGPPKLAGRSRHVPRIRCDRCQALFCVMPRSRASWTLLMPLGRLANR